MTERLLLDEPFSVVLAEKLRQDGFDVVAVAELPGLAGAADEQVFQRAILESRRLVTENVGDFRPLLVSALSASMPYAPLLLTPSRRHPRRSSGLGPWLAALTAWLERDDPPRQAEEWL